MNVTDLNISVDLTAEGVQKWPEIVEIIFQFIYLIHQLSEDELQQQFRKYSVSINNGNATYNGIIVFICTDAWAPFCIFLHVSGQSESVH